MRSDLLNKRFYRFIQRTPRLLRRGVFVCLTFGLISGSLLAAEYSSPPIHCDIDRFPLSRQRESVEISSVVDGDTIRLTDGRKVRLIGINTPELHPGPEPFANEAKRSLSRLLAGNEAILLPGLDDRDSHGRLLAHVFDMKGQSVEAALLLQGLGWHVAISPNLGLADCLSAMEQQARDQGKGVWSQPPTKVSDVEHGGFYLLRGRVTKVTLARTWWISLEGRVAARIAPQNQPQFLRSEIEGLTGRVIELRGWIYPAHSNKYELWRVDLSSPYGLSHDEQIYSATCGDRPYCSANN